MNMKRLLTLVAFFATVHASAQQVNPVPDYVFANRMSAGRNTVTDTAAYFSIGPRYGATRGMMPPMVVDTASFSANKRNGLLIFSVQKNKFLYWDSVGVKWAEMAGTAGTALTSADTAALLSTRAWRQKGIDSLAAIRIAGSGTTNYVPKFTAASTIGNSQIFDNGTSVGIGTATPSSTSVLEIGKNGDAIISAKTSSSTGDSYFRAQSTTSNVLSIGITRSTGMSSPFTNDGGFIFTNAGGGMQIINSTATPIQFFTNNSESMRIFGNGRVFVGTSASDGGYQLDVNGSIRGTSINVNTSGQTLALTTYYGANASGNNLYAGGGGFNSLGAVGETFKGSANTSFGSNAMLNVTTGYGNAAVGRSSMSATTTGYQNSSLGSNSLSSNTTGYSNVAVGNAALLNNTTGYYNISIGQDAGSLINAGGNNVSSNNSIYIGYDARASASGNTNEIVIGSTARGNGNNTVTFGNSSILNNYFTGNINTSAPTGGSIKPWRLGEAATVSPTSPNRTIRVEIDGVVYYIHAKTTND